MRAILFSFLIFLMGINSAIAYDLVLPKEKKSIVNTNYAFFVGKAKNTETIVINDERVYVAPNGAFAHTIKLKDGENRIVVKSNYNTQVYRFYKNKNLEIIKPALEEFEPKIYIVKKDNTPIRKTPVDYGMNRIAHLFEGTNLIINGQKGNFYRVYLAKNKEAWIDKYSVMESSSEIYPCFVTINSETFKNASKHTIEFTEKLPYTIDENEKEIIFKVYNPFVTENSVYTINIAKPEKYSYNLTLNNGTYTLKTNNLPKPSEKNLNNITIVIDPGHGGSEKGAIGCLGDKEKDLNLSIASFLKEELSSLGATVIMTRECDGNISLDDRVKLAKKNSADIFVSIHLNSIPDIKMDIHRNKGTSVYFYNQNSKNLAQIVEESVSKALNTKKDGVKSASFAVIRPTDYIGILIEVAYMTNPLDSLIYTKDDFPQNTAKAIAEGILTFVTEE